ncbi:unnamed protein product [Sympodiomycopsis kandeliae]
MSSQAVSGALAAGQEDGLATRNEMQTEISEKQAPPTSTQATSPNQSHSGSEVSPEEAKEMLGEAEEEIRNEQRKSADIEKDDYVPFDLREFLRNTAQSFGAEEGDDRIARKKLGVSWSNLNVIGTASMDLKVPTIPGMAVFEIISPFLSILKLVGVDPFKPKERKLLQGFNGCAKPGEMVLVIGRPGSGCSTFLKTIADKRSGFIRVEGDTSYGGIDAKKMDQRYRGQVVYSEEDDVHNATLTVSRTVDFALRLKAPSQMLPDHTRKTFRKLLRDTMLKAFNIPHTKHTLVGSPTVRGVSGGERKRVSIIEALCSNATILSWDNSSRGLDASTAFDYAKSMRTLTDFLQITMFVSLYQASDNIFNEFDKVMVIDDGRCVYYGPREECRQYFINLGFEDRPRQTAADYVTGCTDQYERIFQEGRDASNVPSTPEQLEEAYKNSELCRRMIAEKEEYDNSFAGSDKDAYSKNFKHAVRHEKHHGAGRHSQYTVSWPAQVYALFLRQMQMTLGNKFDIFMSYVTAIILALVTGGVFFNLPTTSAGVFTRGGDLFILLLFSSLTAFAELPTMMLGRPILARQAGFAFFRPSALTVASLIADFPFGIPRATIFHIIVYFMSGLHRSAAAFWTSWLIVIVAYYAFRALFSMFGAVTTNFYTAARLAAVIMTMLVLWAGYVIPQDTMARWLFWVSYLNPIFYSFSALMINEFKRTTFTCGGAQIVPSGPGYNQGLGPNQICAVAGATPGSDQFPGMAYLTASFGYQESHLWRNVGILFAFVIGLVAICAAVMEFMDQGAFASAMTVKKPANKEEVELNKRLEDRRSGASEKTEAKLDVYGQTFTWSNLKYTVPVKGGHRQLLDNVDGYVVPGTMTALMGSSGAGKTTLLDVLADRKTIGVIEGDRLIEGKPVDVSFQRQCGYAEQQDIHEPMCSVREALRFSAYLRQPYETPIEEKNQYVEDIIELLELHDLADAVIGYPGFGLGVGDRKRVTIGVELAAKPSMLLFLDEPTSGLDGQSAFTICRVLRKLADNGQTILCTIHQPSSLLFETFDRLLLLQRGGQVVYNGPVGKEGCHINKYFADRGAQIPAGQNPAEFMLDAIGAGSQPRMGPKDWADWYKESDMHKDNLAKIAELNAEGAKKPATQVSHKSEYAAPWMFQFAVVSKRTLLSTWRQPSYQYTRLIQHLVFALLTGLIFLRLDNAVATLQYRVFALFMMAVIPAIIMAQIEPFWIMARSVWIREETSKTFRGSVFAATQLVSEIPYAFVCATVFFLLLYYLVGFQSDSARAAYFWFMTLLVELFAITIGTAIASFSANAYFASLWTPFLIVIMSLNCGVLIPPQLMTSTLFRDFLYNVNPVRFAISGLIANEFYELPVRCAASEYSLINPPGDQTCGQYLTPYIQAVSGYVNNPNATADCQYCTYAIGNEFYEAFGITWSERGRDLGVMIAFIAFNTIVTVLCTKYLKFSNR